jgi:predicted secreted protein
MPVGSAIALFFIIWWLVLFAVLPLGVRNPHEAGEDAPAGSDPGAPVKPMLARKLLITTAVAFPVTALALFLWEFV